MSPSVLNFLGRGKGFFCFLGGFVVVVAVVVDYHKFAAALFNMFEQQPCLCFAVAPEIAVSRIQCLVLRMANEYL